MGPLSGQGAIWLALVIVAPLAAALASVVSGRYARPVAWASIALMLSLSGILVTLVAQGPLHIAVGGWSAPLGIALAADGLSAGFVAVTAVVMGIVMLSALPQFAPRRDGETGESRAGYAFWPLAFFLWAALNAIFLSGDLFNLYVALELLTLAAIGLVAIEGKAETIAAAIRYALFALFGSLAYLLGAVFLYAAYGTLDMALLAEVAEADGATIAAGALMTAGLAAKTALFPFHAWLPPAHSGAPAPASAILSGLVPKASFYIAVRLWFDVLPGAAGEIMPVVLGALGTLAIVYGSLLAMRQNRLKLIVAYSTVAQIGYLFLIFPLAGASADPQPWEAGAWTGAMFHAFSHAAAKASMFLSAGLFLHAVGHDRIDGLKGIARHMPMTAFAFALASVTLMGLPPSGGFTAKYLLLTASFAGGQEIWSAAMILGGLLAALYLFRPLGRAFSRAGEGDARPAPVSRLLQLAPLALACLSILIGIASAGPYDFLQIGRPVSAEEGLE